MQSSRCWMSCASSSFKSASCSSMIFTTSSKCPRDPCRSCTVSRASRGLWEALAAFCSAAYTGSMLELWVSETCANVAVADLNNLRASGESKISMACWIPVSSSSRLRDRSAHSSALSLHAAAVSAKNRWAASNSSSSPSRFSVSMPRLSSAAAFSSSLRPRLTIQSLFCAVLVAIRSSYWCWLAASSAFMVSKFTTKVSYMSFRIPCTEADCGEYRSLATCCKRAPLDLVFGATRSTTAATSTRAAPPVPAPDRTLMAFSKEPMADCISAVSAMKALFSFSRRVVACFMDSSLSAMSASSFAMSFSRVAMTAFNSKISLEREAMDALCSVICSVLRCVVVAHQHAYLSYTLVSALPSASIFACMSRSRSTTLLTGLRCATAAWETANKEAQVLIA
mmetsp:Transcript_14324/g.36216  ORF Transcript_14324/g.36216 Transcript_14324/m.36216 type:complete len:396 (-) Transcript_14324:33-1220(-)